MTKVEKFLDQYKKAIAKEQNLRDEIRRLDERIGIPNQRMDGLPKKHEPQHVTEDMALQLIESKQRYEKQIMDSLQICAHVVEVINTVPDARCARLLYLRYCLDLSWDDVAIRIHYSPEYVAKELNQMALQMLGDVLHV